MREYILNIVLLSLLLTSLIANFTQLTVTQNKTDSFSTPNLVQTNEPFEVSIIQLLANPEKYDGKSVILIGYARIEFEGDSIYLQSEDAKNWLVFNALWLNIPKEIREQRDKYNDKYVVISGKFNAKNHGHMNLFKGGAIENIESFTLWRGGINR